MTKKDDALKLARLFHTTYERLAPNFGYETRTDTKVFDPLSANGQLMLAVCSEIYCALVAQPVTAYEALAQPEQGSLSNGFWVVEVMDTVVNAWPLSQEALLKIALGTEDVSLIPHKPEQPEQKPTYTSTQSTNCASCGEHKHTPLRIDAMGGYVCLTCIDKKLGALLGEFGYAQQPEQREWVGQTDSGHTFILASELARLQRQPLTENQVFDLMEANTKWMPAAGVWRLNEVEFARAIEAKLKEKNT
jgi:hypothetical protein